LWRDVTLAARRLRASPLFLVFAILSLAIGLAVTITAYSVVEAVFWPPLGIADPGRVGIVTAAGDGQRLSRSLSRSDFDELQRTQRAFSSIAAAKTFSDTLVISGVGEAAYGEAVTGGYFAVITVNATVGRTIQPRDDTDATAVVVLSDRLWRSKLGGDPNIVGQVVRLGGHPFEIPRLRFDTCNTSL
jgi:putative ABC transport system permease protein